jgi:hypothetical protein
MRKLADIKVKVGNQFPLVADLLLNLRFLLRRDQSQFGESRLLREFVLSNSDTVNHYLELGCGHPITYSNSLRLPRNWTGIHVDPNASLSKLWGLFRPRDLFLPYAITSEPNIMEIEYFKFPRRHSVLNSVVPEFLETWKNSGLTPKSERVKAITIRESLRIKDVDPKLLRLVMCDIEGFDKQLMVHMLDIELIHPQWILVEDFDSQIEYLMTRRGYKLIGTAGPTKLFKKAN